MRYLLVVISLLFAAVAKAQPPSFIKIYSAPFVEYENLSASVLQTGDNGFLFTGTTVVEIDSAHFEGKIMLFKTDQAGNLQWTKNILLNPFCLDANGYVVRDMGNGFLVAGACSYAVSLARTDVNGDTLWTKSLPWYVGNDVSMVTTRDRGCIVAGTASSFLDSSRVLKFDSTGTLQWMKTYRFTANTRTNDIKQTIDGGYVLLCTATNFIGGASGAEIIKLNAGGDTSWTTQWFDTGAKSPDMKSIIQTSDSGYMATGGQGNMGVVMKLHADGTRDWSLYTSGYDNYGAWEDPGNKWYILSMRSDYMIGLQEINYSGTNINWAHVYGSYYPEYTSDFAHTSDGGFILAGYGRRSVDSANSVVDILIKTDSAGTVISGTSVSGQNEPGNAFSIYPNPANNIINIKNSVATTGILLISDCTGQRIRTLIFDHETEKQADVSLFPPGLYILTFVQPGHETITAKFVKK